WWHGFGDATLDELVARATAGNPSLRVARARSARAQANADVARSLDGPQLGAGFDLSRQRFTGNGLYPPPLAGSTRDTATLQLNGSWDLDIFGRNRAQLQAAVGVAKAAAADSEVARTTLAVNVTRAYVQLGRYVEQRAVLERSLAQRDEVLALIRQRVGAGIDSNVELRQGEGALPETRQQLEAVAEQIALTRHALAALLAAPPQSLDSLAPSLSAVRALPVPDAVPADLLGRRADVVAARWRVEASLGDLKAARAEFYPNVSLTAFVGLSSFGLDRLLRGGSEQYGAGPAIRLPIFTAGRLRAGLRGRAADLDAAVESYNGVLLEAIHDVADQISSVQSVERQQGEQRLAEAAAESAYDLAKQRYRAGLGTYLVVLNAETNVIAQRRIGTDLRARTVDAQLLLVRALGGGYAAPDDARTLTTAGAPGVSLR
ncbi:MAG: efflux transporter outer membrane subunit, partial [Pseudomonadota bacterium]|nr:efflux transporter outer membrane subunit [Pseudomonadota bacterium]